MGSLVGRVSELFAEARNRARQLAADANLTAGRVLGVTEDPFRPYYDPYGGPLTLYFRVTVRLALE